MGNLHNTRELPPTINPQNYPHLHIDRSTLGGSFRYVPSVGTPWSLELHKGEVKGGRFLSIAMYRKFSFPVVPDLTIIPPPEIDPLQALQGLEPTLSTVAEALKLHSPANIILSTHGSFWGLLPESILRTVLQTRGVTVPEAFPAIIGIGRKRIQTHAVIINR